MVVKGNLIVLSCPSCGAKNKILPGSNSIICIYCGTSYIVPSDVASKAREMVNQCPICHQNDRVEKVSAIISKEITHTQSMSFQTTYTATKKGRIQPNITGIPYNTVQSSELAKVLNNPPAASQTSKVTHSKPKPFILEKYVKSGSNMKVISYVIFGLMGSCGLLTLLANPKDSSTSPVPAFICLLALGLLFALPLWLLGHRRQVVRKYPERIATLEQSYQSQLDNYNNSLRSVNEKQSNYQKALQNWNNLYYCYRDDCVFVPGSGKAAPSRQFQSYLYEV